MTGSTFTEIVALLREVTGEDPQWTEKVRPESRLDGDLYLESVEVAALAGAVRDRYGIDLAGHLAGLDLDQLIAFTVGDLVAYVSGRT